METNQIQSDSVTIISEESKSYNYCDVNWHYLIINYSDGTTKIYDQNNNWIHFDTEYEMDLITDEKTNKPLKADAYWNDNAVKNIIAAEVSDGFGKLVIRNNVAECTTPYNVSMSCGFVVNKEISNSIRDTFVHYIKKFVIQGFMELSRMSGNDITVKGPNDNVLRQIQIPYNYPGAQKLGYYDETTRKAYSIGQRKELYIDQACSISNGNTEIVDIADEDVIFVHCLPYDTISRFVWTDKLSEVYYSNGDYLKFTRKDIDAYSLSRYQVYDCIIHRPDGMLTIKLEDIPSGNWRRTQGHEKQPVTRYEYTSGKYKGLVNVDENEKLKDINILGVTTIINPSTGHYWKFIDPKTNHVLTVTDKEGVLYDNTLKQYVTLDGKVKDFEKEAREKTEKERQQLYQKYGKNYVDALFDEGKILVGAPEDLIKNHTQSTLINETQYTRTYKIKGWLNDWGASVDVNVKTGKVTAVRNRTL